MNSRKLIIAAATVVALSTLPIHTADADQMGRGYGMGPGMMGYGYGMGPGMGYGMGPGMMGYGPGYGMGPGMMGYGPGYGMMYRDDLDEDDVRTFLDRHLEMRGFSRLKVGSIDTSDKRIFKADIVTSKEDALVVRVIIDRRTGHPLSFE